jgi:hypothetical protein
MKRRPGGPIVTPPINPDVPLSPASDPRSFYTVARGLSKRSLLLFSHVFCLAGDTYYSIARKLFPGQSNARAAQALQRANRNVALKPGLVLEVPRTI